MHYQGQNKNQDHVGQGINNSITPKSITRVQDEMVQEHLHVLSSTQKIPLITLKTFQLKITPTIRLKRLNQAHEKRINLTNAIWRLRILRLSSQ